jgi:hypothetical protein
MGPLEREARQHCSRVLARVERHIADFPVGETYLGKVAASNPYAVRSLREGRILSPDTLDRLVKYIEQREAAAREAAE